MSFSVRLAGPLLISLASSALADQVEERVDDGSLRKIAIGNYLPYGSVELRHHNNSFHHKADSAIVQQPSNHIRATAGALLYDGTLDLNAVLGAVKYPRTQLISPKRPELQVDYYPIRYSHLSVRQYTNVILPAKENEDADFAKEAFDRIEKGNGTTFVLGANGTVSDTYQTPIGQMTVGLGTDLSSYLFSRRQYEKVDGEEIEDYVPRVGGTQYFNFSYSHPGLPDLSPRISVFYESAFMPNYYRSFDRLIYRYSTERRTYYKARLSYKVDNRVNLIGDLYHFFDGAFAAERFFPQKRFRTMLRIICQL